MVKDVFQEDNSQLGVSTSITGAGLGDNQKKEIYKLIHPALQEAELLGRRLNKDDKEKLAPLRIKISSIYYRSLWENREVGAAVHRQANSRSEFQLSSKQEDENCGMTIYDQVGMCRVCSHFACSERSNKNEGESNFTVRRNLRTLTASCHV